jgi:hypothetical protein
MRVIHVGKTLVGIIGGSYEKKDLKNPLFFGIELYSIINSELNIRNSCNDISIINLLAFRSCRFQLRYILFLIFIGVYLNTL